MKFGLRNTSFVYPHGTGHMWADTRAHIQRAEADHLCINFAGNDAESYELFVGEVMGKFRG